MDINLKEHALHQNQFKTINGFIVPFHWYVFVHSQTNERICATQDDVNALVNSL